MGGSTTTTFLVLAALVTGAGLFAWNRTSVRTETRDAFEAFVAKFERTYASRAERLRRFEIFAANYAFIKAENAKSHSYSLGINQFADMTPDELFHGHKPLRGEDPLAGLTHLGTHRYSGAPLPPSVDWTKKGAVTPVVNQGSCGSSWAFPVTGALEGAWKIATGKLLTLSVQELLDCATDAGQGCCGGDFDKAFQFVEAHGLCTAGSYPYTAVDGTCKANCTVGLPAGAVKGYHDVQRQNTEALMEAVAQQPVAVGIEADQQAFQLYAGGIISAATCGTLPDHGALLVGYGTEKGVDYWKVKNTYGATWGEGGYVRLKRDVPKDGECGINDMATYPIVKKVVELQTAEQSKVVV